MREAPRFVHGVSISPGKVCRYAVPEAWIIHGYPGSTRNENAPILSAEDKARANRRRVISRYWQAVGWLWLRSRRTRIDLGNGKHLNHRQGLLTLTLPGVATADHIQVKAKILDPFFTYCRNVLGLKDYVWVAELQERGEIHFHAIINQFLPKDRVREAWLRCCDASGIISGSKEGYRPATRIEECKDYKGTRAYAAKYMSKALRSGDIIGRVWSGSHSVTGIGKLTTNEVEQSFNVPAALFEINQQKPEWRQYDHGIEVARFDLGRISKKETPVLFRLFRDHINRFDNPPAPHDLDHMRTAVNAPAPTGPQAEEPERADLDNPLRIGLGGILPGDLETVYGAGLLAGEAVAHPPDLPAKPVPGWQPDLWHDLP